MSESVHYVKKQEPLTPVAWDLQQHITTACDLVNEIVPGIVPGH